VLCEVVASDVVVIDDEVVKLIVVVNNPEVVDCVDVTLSQANNTIAKNKNKLSKIPFFIQSPLFSGDTGPVNAFDKPFLHDDIDNQYRQDDQNSGCETYGFVYHGLANSLSQVEL